MSYIEIKNIFIYLLGFTLFLYFFSDMFKYKLEDLSKDIYKKIISLNIFEDKRIKDSYNQFKEDYYVNFTFKKYKDLKEREYLSKKDKEKLSALELDIIALNISFAYSSIISNPNSGIFPDVVINELKGLMNKIKFINKVKAVSIILTQICLILFIYLVF